MVTTLVALFVKGLTGFGSALIIVPIFALFMPLNKVVHAIALPLALSNLPMAFSGWKHLPKRAFMSSSISFAVGIALGSYWIDDIPDLLLRKVLGVTLVIFSIFQLLGGKTISSMPTIRWAEIFRLSSASFVSGIIAGLVGVGGIPLVIYLSFRYPKEAFRHLSNYTFLLGAFVQVILFMWHGYYTPDTVQLTLWMLLPTFIGLYFGAVFSQRVSQRSFNRMIGAMLMIPAVNLLF